jgi:primosomal protein N'
MQKINNNTYWDVFPKKDISLGLERIWKKIKEVFPDSNIFIITIGRNLESRQNGYKEYFKDVNLEHDSIIIIKREEK